MPLRVSEIFLNYSFVKIIKLLFYIHLGNLTLSGIIVKTCKIIMPNLLGSLKRATDHYTSGSSSLGVVHPNHILLSLKALCSGVVELNDTDFEQLENYLKDSDIFKDSG